LREAALSSLELIEVSSLRRDATVKSFRNCRDGGLEGKSGTHLK
jgi:hypothetical protein